MDDVDDPCHFRAGTQMRFCHFIVRICGDLRVVDALAFVLNISMDSDLDIVMVELLKSNHCNSFQQAGIKAESQLDRAVFLFRLKGLAGPDLFAGSILQRFSVRLVHQCSLYRIGAADNKVGVGDHINNGRFFTNSTGRVLRKAVFGIGRDGGIEDCLVRVVQVCVACHFHAIIEKILKYDARVVRKLPGKDVRVQCKNHFYASFCFLRVKFRRRSDLLTVFSQDRLASPFIHQNAVYPVMASGHKVFIRHRIDHGRLSRDCADFIFCFSILRIGADLRVMDALVLIPDVRVDSNADFVVVKILKSDNGLSFQKSRIKGKGKLN